MKFYDFEKRYQDILETIDEWAYIRVPLAMRLQHHMEIDNKKIIKKSSLSKIYNKLKKTTHIFYGFKNWFRGYEYLFFSDSDRRKYIEGEYFDMLCDPIIQELGIDKSLMIEENNSVRHPMKSIYTKYIVSKELLKFLSTILVIFNPFRKSYYENINKECIEILKEYNINLSREINTFNIQKKVYYLLLKLYRPKAIFVVCGYCNFPLIKVAKELNIDLIEIQHGIINQSHYGYNSYIKLNREYYPKEILTFGELDLDTFLIDSIYPVGHFYLDYLGNSFQKDRKLSKIIDRYRYIIGVSLQPEEWELSSMLNFIEQIALKDKTILYILIPRYKQSISIPNLDNIITYNSLDCYQIILHSNIHMTLYSSCAIEAPVLGIPNLLVDTANMATKYYLNILSDSHTKIISNSREFFNNIDTLTKLDREKIIRDSRLIVSNYRKNIKEILQKMGGNR